MSGNKKGGMFLSPEFLKYAQERGFGTALLGQLQEEYRQSRPTSRYAGMNITALRALQEKTAAHLAKIEAELARRS